MNQFRRGPRWDHPGDGEGCLPGCLDSVSGSADSESERAHHDWEANTLPLSYTRPKRTYFSPENRICKTRVFASVKTL